MSKTFFLPDLGEGLPDAQIQEWYVAVGDEVKTDQPLVAMETAKAVVDVPAPFPGKITQLYGKAGDTINTGDPLVEFECEECSEDAGTVVGKVESSNHILKESATGVRPTTTTSGRVKATPALRALAKQLGVDLNAITPSGPGNTITVSDIQQAQKNPSHEDEKLTPVQRAMVASMSKAHQEIVPCTLVDDANISNWPAQTDITLRVIRAIQAACQAEPQLNAHFNGDTNQIHKSSELHLGLAVDTQAGLYVPVLKNVAQKSDQELRQEINQFKNYANQNKFPAEMLKGATFTLSNFGIFAGRYATPIVVPPQVAIIATGKLRHEFLPVDGEPVAQRIMPISLTFDHRAVTGGQAARFLQTLLKHLGS